MVAQRVKGLASKSDDPSSLPRTQWVESPDSSCELSADFNVHTAAQSTHTNVN